MFSYEGRTTLDVGCAEVFFRERRISDPHRGGRSVEERAAKGLAEYVSAHAAAGAEGRRVRRATVARGCPRPCGCGYPHALPDDHRGPDGRPHQLLAFIDGSRRKRTRPGSSLGDVLGDVRGVCGAVASISRAIGVASGPRRESTGRGVSSRFPKRFDTSGNGGPWRRAAHRPPGGEGARCESRVKKSGRYGVVAVGVRGIAGDEAPAIGGERVGV